jgi:transcriptional/translational regulatory protein YebC/TACO1
VKEALETGGFAAASAKIQMVPSTTIAISGEQARQMLKLYEALDEHEDVAEVYANFEMSDSDLLAAAGGSQ